MRFITTFFTVISLVISVNCFSQNWQTSFEESKQLADRENKSIILVFSGSDWCGPCKMMAPILQDVKNQIGDQVNIIKVDVDRNPQAAASFNIQGVPTLILFRNGKVLWRQSGVQDASTLIQIVKQHL